MKYDSNRENVQIAAAWLREMGYDAWLTATRERSDPAVKAIFGSVVVGSGVYLVTKEGKGYLVANAIDMQEGATAVCLTKAASIPAISMK